MMRPPIAAAWRASAARRDPATWAAACRALGIVAVTAPRRRRSPIRCASIRSRRRCCSSAATSTCWAPGGPASSAPATPPRADATPPSGSAGRSPRPASPSCRAWPRASTAPPTAVSLAVPAAGRRPSSGNGPGSARTPACTPSCGARSANEGCCCRSGRPGTPPEPFRFPMRNRILAALSEVLVVVESRERGGSLITAQAALERSIDVLAVPGSPRNRAAAGTNHLLRDGAAPVTGRRRRPRRPRAGHPAGRGDGLRSPSAAAWASRPPCWPPAGTIRARWTTSSSALALPMADAAMALARLERTGWVRESGGWFEPVVSWSGR